MKIKLPDSISSPQDLMAAIADVRQYSKWYGQTANKVRVAGTDPAAPIEPLVISPPAAALVNEWAGGKPLTRDSLDELVEALNAYASTAPQITVTLAGPAPGSLRQTMIAWFRENVDPNVLVNFKFNATILGGMVVVYGSHIFDWSFRRPILDARGKFGEVLRHV